jgi:hypothetical protein
VGQYQDIRANLPDNQWLGAHLNRHGPGGEFYATRADPDSR